jgi:hypothetical protein
LPLEASQPSRGRNGLICQRARGVKLRLPDTRLLKRLFAQVVAERAKQSPIQRQYIGRAGAYRAEQRALIGGLRRAHDWRQPLRHQALCKPLQLL